MMLALKNIIATRRFTRHIRATSPDMQSKVEVRIGKPMRDDAETAHRWYCRYQIIGIGNDTVRSAYGADSVQALYLALVAIGIHLSNSLNVGDLYSETDETEPNFGFPTHIGIPSKSDTEG